MLLCQWLQHKPYFLHTLKSIGNLATEQSNADCETTMLIQCIANVKLAQLVSGRPWTGKMPSFTVRSQDG